MQNAKIKIANKNSKPKPKLKFEFSAGGVCYKKENGEVFMVIFKPKDKNTWQLPKGWIDKGETAELAAVREVKEEGGVEGKIVQKIDTIKYFYNWEGEKRFKTVTFYLMEYLSGDPKDHDWEAEAAEWVEISKAIERLTFRGEKEIVEKAKELIVKN